MGIRNSGTVSLDGNNYPLINFPTTEKYQDNNSGTLVLTNLALATNVVTATFTASADKWKNPFIGQSVTIANTGQGTFYNGVFTVTAVTINGASSSITYAKTHADDTGGACTGTITLGATSSPVSTGASDEISLVAPSNTVALEVYCSAIFTLRKVSGGATLGVYKLAASTYITIACQAGDKIYISRTDSGTLDFRFKCLQ